MHAHRNDRDGPKRKGAGDAPERKGLPCTYDKRGPATVAATLYRETPESIAARERAAAERRLARPPGADLGARPTKLDRRRLEALPRGPRRARRSATAGADARDLDLVLGRHDAV